MRDLYRIDPDRTDKRSNFVADRFTVRDRFGAEVGVLVKVKPTDSIKWCFTHEEELGTYLSICDSEWRRNERRIRMGEDVLQNCDIGDALLVRAREDTA